MQKYALLDIGNTNVKLAFVDNKLIQNKIIFETEKFKEKFDDLNLNHISHLFISSVVPELNQYFNFSRESYCKSILSSIYFKVKLF